MVGLLVALAVSVVTSGADHSSSLRAWIDSAEAVFVTREEATAWKRLADDEDRARFIESYWRRRDPKPETVENEFRDALRQRIAEANRLFAIGGRRGVDTARGRVYVLLGAAGAVRQTAGPIDTRLRSNGIRLELPDTALQTREWHTWVYDLARADVLASARRPSIEISFVVEPGRKDVLQDPGRFESIRAAMAAASLGEHAGSR